MSYTRNPLYQLTPPRVKSLLQRLQPLLWEDRQDLRVIGGPVNKDFVDLEAARQQPMDPVVPGETFAGPGDTWRQRWFKVNIPAAEDHEKGRRYLFWDSQGETTVFLDDQPWAGLDIAHRYCTLPDKACELWLDTGTYQTAIWYDVPKKDVEVYGCRFSGAWTANRNQIAWEGYWDFYCLDELMKHLLSREGWVERRLGLREPFYEARPLLRILLHELEQACDIYDTEGASHFSAYLKTIYTKLPAAPWQGHAAVCGHAHIDLVWLWPERVGRRKHVHTFSTILRLMDHYPEFRFTHSQPIAYEEIKRSQPKLYEQVLQRIGEKRWEATGGFVVECDVNIPCGEALARELLYGQKMFSSLRGGDLSRTVWVPDVFGYSNCLPQIMKLAGIEGFFTTKIIWSSITRFPHNALRWRGADGSEVLTFLCPAGYNEPLELDSLMGALNRNTQAGIYDEALLPQGFGDGGGGPTIEMCERAKRYRDLATVPKTRWTGVEDFFDGLRSNAENLPTFEGELYLELHRGTYTSQANMKHYYRKAEQGLQVREAVAVTTGTKPDIYPDWLRVCFSQFHDALPGSSIGIVYQELVPELKALAEKQLASASAELESGIGTANDEVSVYNPSLIPRRTLVELTEDQVTALKRGVSGEPRPIQPCKKDGITRYVTPVSLPGLMNTSLRSPYVIESPCSVTHLSLDNGIVHAEFDADGRLASLRIDEQDILLRSPAGLKIYPDYPADWDAWDIDRHTLAIGTDCCLNMPLSAAEQGEVRAALRGGSPLGERSSLAIRYSVEADSPYLFIDIDVEWKEDHRLLKYHVPTHYHGKLARYGSPFGSIYRPQKTGFPNEESQWEVPGSRWAAVSDDRETGGAAIITESKYGFSCRDGDLAVSLLRAPSYPDPSADRGTHHIRFALGLHRTHTTSGGKNTGQIRLSTAAAAEVLFSSSLVTSAKAAAAKVNVRNCGSLVPSWVFPSETTDGIVVRLHETAGDRGKAVLELADPPNSVTYTDFLERTIGEVKKTSATTYEITYAPYKVITILIR